MDYSFCRPRRISESYKDLIQENIPGKNYGERICANLISLAYSIPLGTLVAAEFTLIKIGSEYLGNYLKDFI